MVVWAEMVGCIVGINSFLMGLVVLASGTSGPSRVSVCAKRTLNVTGQSWVTLSLQ